MERIRQIRKSQKIENFNGYSIYSYSLPIKNLPKSQEGLRLLHLSDIHFKKEDESRIYNLKDLSERVSPDVILFTGDFIDKTEEDLTDGAKEIMKDFFKDKPKYFVLGSHDVSPEHLEDTNYVRNFLENYGYKNVENILVQDETGIVVGGVEDDKFKVPKIPIYDPDYTNILLTHKLDNIEANNIPLVDLILSGHLHDGEINLGVVDGGFYLKHIAKDYQNKNKQGRNSWKTFGNTASYISPGFSRHHSRFLTKEKGATLINLLKEK